VSIIFFIEREVQGKTALPFLITNNFTTMDKKVLKIYQLQHTYLKYTPVYSLNNKLFTCHFEGGLTDPVWRGGTFSTENQEEQQAIEKSRDYQNGLIAIIYTSEPEQVKLPEAVEVVQEIEQAIEQEKQSQLPELRQVKGVKNASDAKRWLNANIAGATHAMMPNRESVLKIAADKNIAFPDWKIE
jgi:hypothetical protein